MRRYQEGGRAVGHPMLVPDPETGVLSYAETRLDPERGAMLVKQLSQMQGAISEADMESLRQAAEFAGVELGKSVATTGLQGTINALRQQMDTKPLTTHQMRRMLETGRDVEEIEAEQIERSYNTTGTGGRIETHANGALEWVPNGPGDIPQPPVGDVFYDPIEELRMEQEAQGFARGGAVKKFQAGGLAAVTEEEQTTGIDPRLQAEAALQPQEIVERTTGIRPGMSITDLILQNKQANIDRLKETRTNLAARRQEARQREEQDRWLAFAQAMLAPTRTGAFGESLGVAAGNLRQQRALEAEAEAAYQEQDTEMAQLEIAQENLMIDQMLKDSAVSANRAKGIHGSIQTMVHPEDVGREVLNQRIIFGAVMRDPNDPTSEMALRPLENPDRPGEYFEAASKLDPERAAALARATEEAESATARSDEFISEAIDRRGALADIRGAIELLESNQTPLSTSGLQELKNRLANFVGVDLGDTTELTLVQMAVARDFLQRLADLKGPASDRDVRLMRSISVGLGQNTEANYIRLRQMVDIYEGALSRGVREAWYASQSAGTAADRRAYRDVIGDLWPSVAGFKWDPKAVPISTVDQYYDLEIGAPYFLEGDWGGEIKYRQREPGEEE